ncbi:shikimate kinase [Ideonella sp. 4Y16]|uniref:Shikimate kinase n=1 Tax=Ideonella alba TaxID=2824118 RepID=A0A940YDN7_9BURK|nr:shikimate kinase [Ideonella alba]MBQ0931241.1 shikimate kinase [Ideonella alba]MBQ0944386.1 shikimate kinase [Ideonella alba]
MISLVGMPGSGKSTIGRQLARELGWRFVDTDIEIEHRLGESIRAHFERMGEGSFRAIESSTLAELAQSAGASPLVMATGGGAVLREANRAVLRAAGPVVYLRSSPEDLARRLRHDQQRPLLQGGDPLTRLRNLYRERDPLYRDVASYTLDTGRSSVPTLVRLLLSQLELAGVVPADRPPHRR